MSANYTPTPWRIDVDGGAVVAGSDADDTFRYVAQECTEADGEFIVRACNSYAELLHAAQLLRALATSPRFQGMTVAYAFAELKENGFGPCNVAATEKVIP